VVVLASALGLALGLVALGACSSDKAAVTTTTSSSGPPASTTTTTPPPPPTTTTVLAVPVAATGAAGLAAQAVSAEKAVRDPAVTGEALARAGWEQQVVYRALLADPALRAEVVRLVPGEWRTTVEANARAGAELRAMTPPQPAPPDNWRILAPRPLDQLLALYKEAERETGVPWEYLASVHLVETKLSRIKGPSTAGAQGPMQFLPGTWKQYGRGGDVYDDHDAILGAARLLKANGAPGRMGDALYSYNHSQRYVTGVSLYAERMVADEAAFRGYYGWQVYYRTVAGDRVLLPGYPDVPAL
jgi:membrane-bound lytic murein transglycosylase B